MYIIRKNNDDKWIIIKKGGKRATRVFDTKAEAIAYANLKLDGNYELEDEFTPVRKVARRWPKVFWTIFAIVLILVVVFGVLYFTGVIGPKDNSNDPDITEPTAPINPTTPIAPTLPTPGSGSTANPVDPNASFVENVVFDDLQFHFMEFGNGSNGDATYIKAGDNDILIDAGSEAGSATNLIKHINEYCTDGVLEYVITTHADTDHISGMFGLSESTKNFKGENVDRTGILYYYDVVTLIDFSRTNKEGKTNVVKYRDAVNYAVSKGTIHYTAEECWNETNGAQRSYKLSDVMDISMDILYNKYYFDISDNENDFSVITMFNYNDLHYLFTGDLEKKGEKAFVEYYDGSTPFKTIPEVELFKAGHHGSPTSSNADFLELIKPKSSVASCIAGAKEYTKANDNIFPSQAYIDRIAKYTDRVYVPTMINYEKSIEAKTDVVEPLNGTIIVSSNGKQTGLQASNNLTKLKDSTWFNSEIYLVNGQVAPNASKGVYYTKNDANAVLTKTRIWPSYGK